MMNNTMSYKGYVARIDFDGRDDIFVGRVLGTVDRISFHGTCVSELTSSFHVAIDQYLLYCASSGKQPELPARDEEERTADDELAAGGR